MKQMELLTALQAADARVRQEAVWGLGRLDPATPEVVAGLLSALQDADPAVRRSAAEVLGALGQATPEVLGALGQATPEVLATLLAALQDDPVRDAAVGALVALDHSSPDVLYGLLAALHHGDASVRARAAEALVDLCQATTHRTARSGQALDLEREGVLRDRLSQAKRAEKQQWFLEAQQLYGEALTIARELGDRAMEGRILRRLALAKAGLVPFQERLDLHEQAVAIARELGEYAEEQANLAAIAYLHERSGRMSEELARHKQARAVAQAAGDPATADGHLRTMVYLLRYTGWIKEAPALRVLAVTIARQSSDPHLEAGIMSGGLNRHYSRRTAFAQAHFEVELATMRRLHHDPGAVVILSKTAEVHRALHEITEARTHYTQALTLAREVGDRLAAAALLGEIASCHEQTGRAKVALAHYEQAVTIARAVGDLSRNAAVLPGLLPAVQGSKSHAELMATCVALQATCLDGIAFCKEQTGRRSRPRSWLRWSRWARTRST
jgi:tetratricopeptide (TPR) repeat protein